MPRISQTQKTAPLRKAVVVRRALGVFALAGLFALPQTAQAQDRGPRGGDPEQRVAQLDEALDLSAQQESQLLALFEAQDANQPARGERRSGDREAMRAQREAQRAELERQLADVLTPAQMERYQALQEAQQGRGRRGDGR